MMNHHVERIRQALHFIPAHDRETWVRMGMAVRSALGEDGFDSWNEWSQQDESYDPTAARDVWRSIRAGGKVTEGTLFREAKRHGWCDDTGYVEPTAEELATRRREAEDRARIEAEREASTRRGAQNKAAALLSAAKPARADHLYLVRKQVSPSATLQEIDADAAASILGYAPKSHGDLLTGRLLVVPVGIGGVISTCELIDFEGRKSAIYGGAKAGKYWSAQALPTGTGEGLILLVGEGVATVLSASAATGHPGIAALSSGNLLAVANAIRERYPAAQIVILADLVKATGAPDPHAIKAARAVGGVLAIPDFGGDRSEGMTDFNDLVAARGPEAVRRSVADATAPPGEDIDKGVEGDLDGWPEPQELVGKMAQEPYPIDALPDTVRAAVEEVQGFVQAPVAMVAGCALSAMSVATQAHVDVKRADTLHGPTGLFILTIADSGERKSTCDRHFTAAVRDYEAAQGEAAKPELVNHRSAIASWEAKNGGIKDKIRQLAKGCKPTHSMETALRDLESDKPEPPRIPRLLYGDATPEALAHGLAKGWPSAGVVSAEAGIVFGSHGMGKDSIMRNMGFLNVMWDGGSHSVDRKTSESFTVKGARLTVALQVQEPTLREFFDKSGTLARGTGFLARFLVAWPESTQGHRPFIDPPASWPGLTEFNRRLASILDRPAPIDGDGALTPTMLELSPDAKKAWREYHDAIEADLKCGGALYDVRDVAAKSADNAVRLAALFHVLEHGVGAIGLDAFEGASRIAAWHLSEARRFFGELALPADVADAVRLDAWLIDYCTRERTENVGKRDVQRCGPVRDGGRLDAAIRVIAELDRAKLVVDGKRRTIYLNPALLAVKP